MLYYIFDIIFISVYNICIYIYVLKLLLYLSLKINVFQINFVVGCNDVYFHFLYYINVSIYITVIFIHIFNVLLYI